MVGIGGGGRLSLFSETAVGDFGEVAMYTDERFGDRGDVSWSGTGGADLAGVWPTATAFRDKFLAWTDNSSSDSSPLLETGDLGGGGGMGRAAYFVTQEYNFITGGIVLTFWHRWRRCRLL